MKASVQVGTCSGCSVPTRKQSAKPEDHPGTKMYGGNGMCTTCYQCDRRHATARPEPTVVPCDACDRPMRPKRTELTEFPDTVRRAAHGLCEACYDRWRRGGDPYEAALQRIVQAGERTPRDNRSWLKIGSPIQLIRWTRTPDGHVPELVDGKYQGCTDDVWRVSTLRDVVEYDRTVWEVTVP